ncbi:MAG: sigma-54 interaction domain-containing protein [Rhodopila sp.]
MSPAELARPADESGRALSLSAACASLGLVGNSPVFRAALGLAGRFASCDAPVLISGQTGNGKELFARLVHYLSLCRGRPFVPVNCGALPDTLIESELFGHARGAFTDARTARPGLVTLADCGTLFLDEIDSLSPKAQVTLLRFLQDREYRPVGGRTLERANVRVIAATNADLAAKVAAGTFRQDLLFRLDVLNLHLPSLADRREDIPLLARFFLGRFAAAYGRPVPSLDQSAEAWLDGHEWSGNVRELENRIHRAVILYPGERIGAAAFGLPAPSETPREEPLHAMYGDSFKVARARETQAFEERYLRAMMAATQGNVSEAARRAGIERRAMGRLLKRRGIQREDFQR